MKGLSSRRALGEIGAVDTKTWWEKHGADIRNWVLGAVFIILLIILACGMPE